MTITTTTTTTKDRRRNVRFLRHIAAAGLLLPTTACYHGRESESVPRSGLAQENNPRRTACVPGDFDQSGAVDFGDFLGFSEAFGQPVTDSNAHYDLDENGVVDFGDFLIVSQNFGKTGECQECALLNPCVTCGLENDFMRMRVECTGPTGQFVVDSSDRLSEPLIQEDFDEMEALQELDPDDPEWSGLSRWEAFEGAYAESLICNYSTVPEQVGCDDCPAIDTSKSWTFGVSHAVWSRENPGMDETDVSGCVQALALAAADVGSFEHGSCQGEAFGTATVADFSGSRLYTVHAEFLPYETPPCDIATTEAACEADGRCDWDSDECDGTEYGSAACGAYYCGDTCEDFALLEECLRAECEASCDTHCEPTFTGECTQCTDADHDASGYAIGSFYCPDDGVVEPTDRPACAPQGECVSLASYGATDAQCQAEGPCAGVDCDDENPCTQDSCAGGICSHQMLNTPECQVCEGCECGPAERTHVAGSLEVQGPEGVGVPCAPPLFGSATLGTVSGSISGELTEETCPECWSSGKLEGEANLEVEVCGTVWEVGVSGSGSKDVRECTRCEEHDGDCVAVCDDTASCDRTEGELNGHIQASRFFGLKFPKNGELSQDVLGTKISVSGKCGATVKGRVDAGVGGGATENNGYNCGPCTPCEDWEGKLSGTLSASVGCEANFQVGRHKIPVKSGDAGQASLKLTVGGSEQWGECEDEGCTFGAVETKVGASISRGINVGFFRAHVNCFIGNESCAETNSCGECSTCGDDGACSSSDNKMECESKVSVGIQLNSQDPEPLILATKNPLFQCDPSWVGPEQEIGDTAGPGSVVVRPSANACDYNLYYVDGTGETQLSTSPAGFLTASAIETQAGELVVCATRIDHHADPAAEYAAHDDPALPLHFMDEVAVECSRRNALGLWSQPELVVAPGSAWAAWLQEVRLDDEGTVHVDYTRDSTFQFLNLTNNGRPSDDGIFSAELEGGGLGVTGTETLRSDVHDAGEIDTWIPTEDEQDALEDVIDFGEQ